MTQDRPRPPSTSRGIEELLALAAVDPAFAAALERDRKAAIEASGVALSPAEREVLRVTEEPALRQMAASLAGLLSEQDRREFLGRSAAAVALLLGAAATTGCPQPVTGSRPDPPPPEPAPVKEPVKAPPPTPPEPVRAIGGLTATPDARPQPPAPTGIRPDRPGPTRGIRPDRPILPKKPKE